MKMLVNCKECGVEFNKKPAEIKRTRNNMCSRKCAGAYRKKKNDRSFHDKYLKTDGCWNWQGSTNANGYGVVRYGGKIRLAHRVSFMLANGWYPNNLALHSCDNPRCVNPNHLRDGTYQDNYNDMRVRGRSKAKLSQEKASIIRASRLPNAELAKIFGVCERTIRDVKAFEIWQPLPEAPE